MKLFGQCRFSWHGLWLLIILLFTNVISTSLSILNCPRLKDQNGEASVVISITYIRIYRNLVTAYHIAMYVRMQFRFSKICL